MECSSIVILFEHTLYYMIVEELICLVYLDLPVERFIYSTCVINIEFCVTLIEEENWNLISVSSVVIY